MLSLNNCFINDSLLEELSKIISSIKNLKKLSLNLRNNSITNQGFQDFFKKNLTSNQSNSNFN
jgi:hypothetical protein